MAPRVDLQSLLETTLGTNQVYFQPPDTLQMAYPCIVYQRDDARTSFAGDLPYRYTQRYMVTIIDRNPDSLIPAKVAALPLCAFNRFYTANNLNHDVFVLYY